MNNDRYYHILAIVNGKLHHSDSLPKTKSENEVSLRCQEILDGIFDKDTTEVFVMIEDSLRKYCPPTPNIGKLVGWGKRNCN